MRERKSAKFFAMILSLALLISGFNGMSFASKAEPTGSRYYGAVTIERVNYSNVAFKVNDGIVSGSVCEGDTFNLAEYTEGMEEATVSFVFEADPGNYLTEITNGEVPGYWNGEEWIENENFQSYIFFDERATEYEWVVPESMLDSSFSVGCETISTEQAEFEDFTAGDGEYLIQYSFQVGEDGDDGIGRGGDIRYGFGEDEAEIIGTLCFENMTKICLDTNKITFIIDPDDGNEIRGVFVDGTEIPLDEIWIDDEGTGYFLFEDFNNDGGSIPYINVDFGEYNGPSREYDYSFHVEGFFPAVELSYKVGSTDDSTDYVLLTDVDEYGSAFFNIEEEVLELGEKFNGKLIYRIDCTATNGKVPVFADFTMESSEVTTALYEVEDGIWEYELEPVPTAVWRHFNVTLGYENAGKSEINDVVNNYIYEYYIPEDGLPACGTDIATNIKQALAKDLFYKFIFVPAWESFGLDPDNPVYSFGELYRRLEIIGGPYPTGVLTGDSNTLSQITVYDVKIHWGVDIDTGLPVESVVPVYIADKPNTVLIWVDGTLYLRVFGDSSGYSDMRDFDGDGMPDGLVVISPTIATVKAGGLGTDMYIRNQSDNLLSMELFTKPEYEYLFWKNLSVNVRIMKESATYVRIVSEGETKSYGSITSDSGQETDDIWETGNNKTSYAFIGDNVVHVSPVSDDIAGVTVKEITDVRLADENQAAGVEIDTTDLRDVKVSFLSNFYDNVKLIITYSDGSDKELTILRRGLVIDYMYLDHESTSQVYGRDCYNQDGPSIDYNYAEGEEIAVMATYYHPSNDPTLGDMSDLSLCVTYADGTTEIIPQYAFYDADINGHSDVVDTTFFLLGFMPAHDANGMITFQYFERNGHRGGLNAAVVNRGFDAEDEFGGVQIGSGKGVYWNGEIRW